MRGLGIATLILLATGYQPKTPEGPATPAAPSAESAKVKVLAQGIGDAMVRGDHGNVIDHTYPPIVDRLGGREKALEKTEAGMKEMAASGIKVKAVKAGDPGEFVTDGTKTYVVIPTELDMTFPKGTLRSKSYLLGISTDGGKTWTFADGSGLQKKEARDKVLPNLPEKLKLPELTMPAPVPDGD